MLESTSTLTTFILPAYSTASWSMVGAMTLHGPHHAAQKSTRTGTDDLSTSCSKFASVTAAAFAMILPLHTSCDSIAVLLMSRGTHSVHTECERREDRCAVKRASNAAPRGSVSSPFVACPRSSAP